VTEPHGPLAPMAAGRADSCDDAAIIRRSVAQPEAFAALFDRHSAGIYRYLARRVEADLADDLVAETFLAAFAARERYDTSRPDARPWLFGIATNLLGRHRRQEARFFRAIARAGADSPAGESAAVLADEVADRVTAQSVRRQLAAGLASLSRGERDVVLLIAAAGLSYQEVATTLGVPPGTVSSRLVRARHKLRQALGQVDPRKEQQ
jgi:RNA polymerase sigma factor (sigma-70 family)